jgi:hypothetical protein
MIIPRRTTGGTPEVGNRAERHGPRDDPANMARSPGRRCGTRRSRRKNRRGAAVVEFAFVAPLLFMLIFGIIEFGRLLMVQQILTNASREGARRAVLEQATASEVESVVTTYMSSSSVSGASVTVSPSQLTSLGFGDPVTVSCSIPFDQVNWPPAPWFLGGTQLSAESIMHAGRPE